MNPKAYVDFLEDVEIVQISLACRHAVGFGCDAGRYTNMKAYVGQADAGTLVWEAQFGAK